MKSKFKWYNNSEKTRFIKVDNTKFKPFMDLIQVCIQCGNLVSKPTNGGWMGKCGQCGNIVSFFKPFPIQELAGVCEANIVMNVGAVGSGKTTISSYLLSTQLRMIANSKLICAAQTMDQLTRNAIPELKKFFHESEIIESRKDSYWKLRNGSIIEFWPSDNADKLRSANANFIWLVEANSHTMQLFFNEATSRIRNQLGLEYEYDKDGKVVTITTKDGQIRPKILRDKNMIIVEGNPKRGAWFNQAILQAHTILYTPQVRGMQSVKARAHPLRIADELTGEMKNVNLVGILNATIDNPTLSGEYLHNMRLSCATKEEYEQKVFCDITSQDGLVFKEVVDNPDRYFKPLEKPNLLFNKDLVWVETMDPGGSNAANDPDAYILGVFNKMNKRLELVDGFRQSGLTLTETAQKIWEIRNKWGWTKDKSYLFVADNAIGRASKQDRMYSLKNAYQLRLNVAITPCNDKAIAAGTNLVKSWYSARAITINSTTLGWLKSEIYSYELIHKPRKIPNSDEVYYEDVYTEVNNHGLDALRYLVVILDGHGFRQDQYLIDYVMSDEFAEKYGPTQQYESYQDIASSKLSLRNILMGADLQQNKPPVKKIKL